MSEKSLTACVFLIIFTISGLSADANRNSRQGVIASVDTQITVLDINDFVTKIRSDGYFATDDIYYYTWENGVFPKKRSWSTIYTEGFIWGGRVHDGRNNIYSVGGTTYRCGLVPGSILGQATGQQEDPNSSDLHVWRVRRDWQIADFEEEAGESGYWRTPDQIRQQYMDDWYGWPVAKGAPFEDINKNGLYEPETDIPGIPGADQTLWLVANDLDTMVTRSLHGSYPIGLEAQITLWGYQQPAGDPFGDITFRRLRLIYKGADFTPPDAVIRDMVLCQWSDPDIFDTSNKAGCDSSLGMVYAYSAPYIDQTAVGYILLAGPLAAALSDTAQFDFTEKYNHLNLPVSSAFVTGHDDDPEFDDYLGTLQWYQLLHGLQPDGATWTDPTGDRITKFPYAGDPATGVGWIDTVWQDRRVGINTGPFTMALGDTQEIISAVVGDIFTRAVPAKTPGRSINFLKNKAMAIKPFLKNRVAVYVLADTLAINDLVRPGQNVDLTAYTLLFYNQDHIERLEWSVMDRPAGSISTLKNTSGYSNALTPDEPGTFHIRATATTLLGYTASYDLTITASDNLGPEIRLSLSPHQITYGDSVFADASATTDPEQDHLYFSFNPIFSGYKQKGPQAWIYPMSAGTLPVQLTVDDGHFSYQAEDSIIVMPFTDDISLRYTYVDTAWQASGNWLEADIQYYFHQNTLLTCLSDTSDGRILAYRIYPDGIFPAGELAISNAVGIIGRQYDLLIVRTRGEAVWWSGPISIFRITPDWQLTPLIENFYPGNFEVSNSILMDDALYIGSWDGPYYKYDIRSDPAEPKLLAISEDKINNPMILNDQYLVDVSGNIYNRRDLSFVSELELPGHGDFFRIRAAKDGLVFVTEFNIDPGKLFIHDITDIQNAVKLSEISITAPDLGIYIDNFILNVQYVADKILAVYISGGFILYDITHPTQTVQKGSFFGGYSGSSAGNVSISEDGGRYYVHGWSHYWKHCIYSGINAVVLSDRTQRSVSAFQLYQNFPNPFNSSTTIPVFLSQPGNVKIEIFNILGQKIKTLLNASLTEGMHEIPFEATGLPSALYFYRMQISSNTVVKKMVLLR